MPKVTKATLEQELSESKSEVRMLHGLIRELNAKVKIMEKTNLTMPVAEMMANMNEASAQVTTAMLRYLEKRER